MLHSLEKDAPNRLDFARWLGNKNYYQLEQGGYTDNPDQQRLVESCVKLDPSKLDELEWLPSTCAYRLRWEGKPLPDWHYLVSGSRETVHEAGQSTRGWTVSEVDAGDLEWHLVDRPL